MNRPPAFQFYAADWFDFKVNRMSYAAQGVYIRLLAYMWKDSKDQCSLVDNNEDIAAALKISVEEWLTYRCEIQRENSPIFLEKNGRLISKRLKAEADKQRNYRQGQKDKQLSRRASSKPAHDPPQASTQLGGSLYSLSSSSKKKKNISAIALISPSSEIQNSETPQWSLSDIWLKDFLEAQTLIPCPPRTFDDPSWWEKVAHTTNGLNLEFLEYEFARIGAYLLETPQRRPAKACYWKRFVRRWLERAHEHERRVGNGYQVARRAG